MASPKGTVNLVNQLHSITEQWTPLHLLTLNSSHSLKLAKVQGDFIWHSHPDTDEMFYIVSGGPLHMDLATSESKQENDGWKTIDLCVGDVFNVPQGVRHRPHSEAETGILMIERVGTVNTGDEEGRTERTVYVNERSS
jgi:mannose-6-phosphate isomerase-like protein (cupin superfamily)